METSAAPSAPPVSSTAESGPSTTASVREQPVTPHSEPGTSSAPAAAPAASTPATSSSAPAPLVSLAPATTAPAPALSPVPPRPAAAQTTPTLAPHEAPKPQAQPTFTTSAPVSAPLPSMQSSAPKVPSPRPISSMPPYLAATAPQFGPSSSAPHFGGVPITSVPQFGSPPTSAAQPPYTSGPYSSHFNAPAPAHSQPSPAQPHRSNPMSMTSLLSHENGPSNSIAATSAATTSAAAVQPPASTSGPSPRMTHASASQPVVTSTPYTSSSHDRHDGWSFAKPQPRQVDPGFAPRAAHPPAEPSARFDFNAYERKRQSSEGGPRPQMGNHSFQQDSDAHRRKMSFDYTRPEPQRERSDPAREHRPPVLPTSGHPGPVYQPYAGPPSARSDSFYTAQQRPVEPPASSSSHHHHHHHHHSSSSQKKANDAPPMSQPAAPQGAWTKAFAAPSPWPATGPPAPPSRPHDEKAAAAAAAQTVQKRKRSEMSHDPSFQPSTANIPDIQATGAPQLPHMNGQPLAPSPQQPPPRPPSPVYKRPPGPLYTAADLDRIAFKPAFVRVDSEQVQSAVDEVKEPRSIGSYTWDPEVDTSIMLDGATLQANVGQRVQVVIDGRWLRGVGEVSIRDPKSKETEEAKKPQANGIVAEPAKKKADEQWSAWDLEPLRRRRVWGTDVYTDDSDILAMAVHSGWLRFSSAVPSNAEAPTSSTHVPEAIEVTLRIAPQLVRYQSTMRAGLKSRSWGNGHDGVSLIVEGVKAVKLVVHKHAREDIRNLKKRRTDSRQQLVELDPSRTQSRLVRLAVGGNASTPYSAEIAARLARALLNAPVDPSAIAKQEDAEMKDVGDNEEEADATDPLAFKLSMVGYTLILHDGKSRHNITAKDGKYDIDDLKGVLPDQLEFGDDGVIVRSASLAELGRFAVDSLSWHSTS